MESTFRSEVVFFEHDSPQATFVVNENGVPFDLTNFNASLIVADPSGEVIMTFPLVQTGDGVLSLNYKISNYDDDPIYAFKPDICYKGQIYLEAVDSSQAGIGLYDIIDPFFSDYVYDSHDDPSNPNIHIVGWFGGEQVYSRTTITDIPIHWRQGLRILPQDVRYIPAPPPIIEYPPYIPPPAPPAPPFVCEIGQAAYLLDNEVGNENTFDGNIIVHALSRDGKKLYASYSGGTYRDNVREWDIPEPWDLTSIVSPNVSRSGGAGYLTAGIAPTADSTVLITHYGNTGTAAFRTYQLVAGSIEFAPVLHQSTIGIHAERAGACCVSEDGRTLFATIYPSNDIVSWEMTSPYDVSTLYNFKRFTPPFDVYQIDVDEDGGQMFMIAQDDFGWGTHHALVYSMSTPNDIDTLSPTHSMEIPGLYTKSGYRDPVTAHTTVGNWTSIKQVEQFCGWNFFDTSEWVTFQNDLGSTQAITGHMFAMECVDSAGRMFISGDSGQNLYEFSFTIGTSGIPDDIGIDLSSLTGLQTVDIEYLTRGVCYDIRFRPDGLMMYLQRYIFGDERIEQFHLSAPFTLPVTGGVLDAADYTYSKSQILGHNGPRTFDFSTDGSILYAFGHVTSPSNQTYGASYALNTAWDLSQGFTAIDTDVPILASTALYTSRINPRGEALTFINQSGTHKIEKYTLTTPGVLEPNPVLDVSRAAVSSNQIWGSCLSQTSQNWIYYSPTSSYIHKTRTDVGEVRDG
jgi:hypothetical protein